MLDKFVIDRATWINGSNVDDRGDCSRSMLLTPNGNRCCLGFAGEACGYDDRELEEELSPSTINTFKDKWPSWMIAYKVDGNIIDSLSTAALITVNDAKVGDVLYRAGVFSEAGAIVLENEEHREQLIAMIFAWHNVEVTFTN